MMTMIVYAKYAVCILGSYNTADVFLSSLAGVTSLIQRGASILTPMGPHWCAAVLNHPVCCVRQNGNREGSLDILGTDIWAANTMDSHG